MHFTQHRAIIKAARANLVACLDRIAAARAQREDWATLSLYVAEKNEAQRALNKLLNTKLSTLTK